MCHALFIHLKGKAKLMNNDFAELLFSHKVMSDSFGTPWPTAHQVPLSMGFPRQEYRSELPFPSPGDIFDSGIEPASLAL